jgi:FkbM family methyltransferase
MRIFKNLIHTIIKFFGFKLVGQKEHVKYNSFNAIHKFIIHNFFDKKNLVIFDVGANNGNSIKRFKKNFPTSTIYSFEPTRFLYDELKKKFTSNSIKIFNKALGNLNGQKKFYQYGYHEVNSFYPMIENSKYKFQRTKKDENNDEIKKNVEVVKLDDFSQENNITEIDILKIDTQGAEVEILAGAIEKLSTNKISIIELEYIVGIAHDIEINLFEIENLLYKNNYKLIAIEHADNIISFSNYQTNLIYVKRNIFEKIKEFHYKNVDVKNVTHAVRHYKKI